MPVLNKETEFYKIPSYQEGFFGASSFTNDFLVVSVDYPSIHQSSIVMHDMGMVSEENEAAIGQIKALKLLGNNWDEEGALPIPEEVISRAIEIVNHINRFGHDVYLATPGPNQEILLMLKSGNREIEIIIYPDREKLVKFDGTEFVEQGNFLGQELSALLEWITRLV
ncbi:hypothetical protein L0P88_04210 [Muricauda sp. SCSIO 64092]|uniref:hypothetical protein n=1 Tax=Allomuricauda sp. SCSIO 64092 TaxID=2908842 RepID=UPI001FF10B3C|nr:hypothetical protein [Muricauda sp. SCSIO 64092]UOY07759.1 hypothetical protein L0P88_04210 [Muricauda sp. SCSIO 64092]